MLGSIFVFCMAMADYATPGIVGGGIPTIGLVIWSTAAKGTNFSFAMSLSIITIAVIGAVIVAMLKVVDITRVMY